MAKCVASIVAGILILCAAPKPAFGNLFVAVPGSDVIHTQGIIGEYTNSGATINASLITGLTGLSYPGEIAVSDGFIYVANVFDGTIGKYTTSGETVNASLITGLHGPSNIEVSGGDLYVLDDLTFFPQPTERRVGKYTTSGQTINASLITGIYDQGLAVSGTDLYVGDVVGDHQAVVGHYTTSGQTIDETFLTGDFLQQGGTLDLEVSGSDLFLIYAYGDGAELAKYNVDGTLIDPALIDSSGYPMAISGTDVFMAFGAGVGKFTTSGEFVTDFMIPLQSQGISGLDVDDSATVPETLSSLWFGLTMVGLLGFARLLRVRRGHKPVAAKIMRRRLLCRASFVLIASTLILCGAPKPVFGNLFISVPGSILGPGYIGEYTNSGATINASLITGLIPPDIGGQIAVSDGFIYVANRFGGTIGKYTTSGATIDPTLISGLNEPFDIEVSGGYLYVTEAGFLGGQRVGKYTTSGATVDASLITGLRYPYALAISGTSLFVGGEDATVGEYTTSGATINASLITVDQSIIDLEVSGSTLFVNHNYGDGARLAKYDVDGTLINPDLLDGPDGNAIAISGTDLFLASGPSVSKYTTSGTFVSYPLIPFQREGISGIAVDDSVTVPETLSTWWFALTTVTLLAFARLLRVRHAGC